MTCSAIIPKKGFDCDSIIQSNINVPDDGPYKLYLKRGTMLYFRNFRGVKVQLCLTSGKLPRKVLKKIKYGDVLNFSFK